jgi:peptide/nickel transport system ATP-binding protein
VTCGGEGAKAPTDPAGTPLLEAQSVRKDFPIEQGLLRRVQGHVHAVDGVSLRIMRGTTLGLVGESGSGKSTLGRLALRLLDPTGGRILFEDQDVTELKGRELKRLRRNAQIVFQDPHSSFDPTATVLASLREPMVAHLQLRRTEQLQRATELLELVGLTPAHLDRFPSELSGGQLQRAAIARALVLEPQLVVLDEPVSSLDVSTQAQVVNLLRRLQRQLGIAYLFIAHDLSVVRHVSERIAVMYLGRIVEEGTAEAIYQTPRHPYTEALLSAIPIPDPVRQRSRSRIVLAGDIPSPANPPRGCHFHSRCPRALPVCGEVEPPAFTADDGTTVFCHLHTEGPALAGAPVTSLDDVTGSSRQRLIDTPSRSKPWPAG